MTASRRLILCFAGMLTLAVVAGVAAAGVPLPLWQRVLLGGEYKGFDPQPIPPLQLTLPRFAKETRGAFVRITPPILTREMRLDGFRAAVIEELSGRQKRSSAVSAVLRFGSAAGAVRALRFFYDDSLRPCPNTCTVSAFIFQVPGIPGAKGSRRVRFKAEGTKRQEAYEGDSILFTSGPFAYAVLSNSDPNGVDRGEMIAAARRLYARVKNSPAIGPS